MIPSDYRLFAAIIREGSLSAAARALTASPAMISKRLARLEDRLGARLVHRTTRRLSLTGAGERFYADAMYILQLIDEAEQRVAGLDGEPSGPLRVSAPTSFGRLHIAPQLHRFLDEYPKIELTFDLSDEAVDLFVDGVDVAVRITSDLPAGIQAVRLADNYRVLCASPAYLDRQGVPDDIDSLRMHRLIAAEGQLPWRLSNDGRHCVVEGSSHIRTNSSEIVRELALGGSGIALRSLWDVHLALASGRLVPILQEWQAPEQLGIYALYPKTPISSPSTDAFISFLKHTLDPPPWGS